MKKKLLNLYDAVMADNGQEVQKILTDNLFSQSKISVKIITGLLVIAVENKFVNAGRAILNYNEYTSEKISDIHFNAIICLAAKSDFLNQLKITYH